MSPPSIHELSSTSLPTVPPQPLRETSPSTATDEFPIIYYHTSHFLMSVCVLKDEPILNLDPIISLSISDLWRNSLLRKLYMLEEL
uniref:Uncharacterized protein n=1 Tax=Oryza brachyantha TaxID=4533 RepID=J3LCI2_ORYBR